MIHRLSRLHAPTVALHRRMRPETFWIISFHIQRQSRLPIGDYVGMHGYRDQILKVSGTFWHYQLKILTCIMELKKMEPCKRFWFRHFPGTLVFILMQECSTDHWMFTSLRIVLAILHAQYLKATLWVWLDGGWHGLWPLTPCAFSLVLGYDALNSTLVLIAQTAI